MQHVRFFDIQFSLLALSLSLITVVFEGVCVFLSLVQVYVLFTSSDLSSTIASFLRRLEDTLCVSQIS